MRVTVYFQSSPKMGINNKSKHLLKHLIPIFLQPNFKVDYTACVKFILQKGELHCHVGELTFLFYRIQFCLLTLDEFLSIEETKFAKVCLHQIYVR